MLGLARTVVKDVLEPNVAESVRLVRAAALADHGRAPDACRMFLGGAHGVAGVVDVPLDELDVALFVVAAGGCGEGGEGEKGEDGCEVGGGL